MTNLLAFLLAASVQVLNLCQRGEEHCSPPATLRLVNIQTEGGQPITAPAPFNAPMRFDREEIRHGQRYWIWLKDGESPCHPEQQAMYGRWCDIAIGDPLVETQAFRISTREVMAEDVQRRMSADAAQPMRPRPCQDLGQIRVCVGPDGILQIERIESEVTATSTRLRMRKD